MPDKDIIRRAIEKQRNVAEAAPANPATANDIILPAEYRIYDGRNFILSDSGPGQPGNERIIIFGKESNINDSNQITHLYIDGTFRISPPMFRQLIVVLARRDDYVVPIFYGLLPIKQEELMIDFSP